jgi:hypothetical protein
MAHGQQRPFIYTMVQNMTNIAPYTVNKYWCQVLKTISQSSLDLKLGLNEKLLPIQSQKADTLKNVYTRLNTFTKDLQSLSTKTKDVIIMHNNKFLQMFAYNYFD